VVAYLKEHEWKNATADDLWRALSTASGREVTAATVSFLDQGGVPLVTAEVDSGGAVRLRQQRFLNFGTQAPGPAMWKIPVTLRYSDGRQTHTQSVLLEGAEQTVQLEHGAAPAWVHPNAGERGYYRWLTSPEGLQAIAAGGPRVLDTRERVGFINNLAALLDGGQLNADDYLATLERFTDDPAPEVVTAVIAGLDKIQATFITPDLRNQFVMAVRRILRPSLKRFGITRGRGEPDAVSLMRPGLLSMLGVHGYDREVMDWARLAARRYMAHPDSVDASIAGAALNLAARDGDAALFEAYRMRFESTKVPSERARFLAALGNFRDGPLVNRALDYALAGPLRPQEIFTIPSNVSENEELKYQVWLWFRSGFRLIVGRIPPYYRSDLPDFARCCDPQRIDQAKAFFGSREAQFPGTREELDKVIEAITDCVGLRERQTPAVVRYLGRSSRKSAAAAPLPGP
jgi:aminopeptidase N